MATIYANAAGVILRVCPDPLRDSNFGAPPGSTQTVSIDETVPANNGVIRAVTARPGNYKVIGGVLQLANGTPVPIAAETGLRTAERAMRQALAGTLIQDLLAGTVNDQTQQRILAFLLIDWRQRNT